MRIIQDLSNWANWILYNLDQDYSKVSKKLTHEPTFTPGSLILMLGATVQCGQFFSVDNSVRYILKSKMIWSFNWAQDSRSFVNLGDYVNTGDSNIWKGIVQKLKGSCVLHSLKFEWLLKMLHWKNHILQFIQYFMQLGTHKGHIFGSQAKKLLLSALTEHILHFGNDERLDIWPFIGMIIHVSNSMWTLPLSRLIHVHVF